MARPVRMLNALEIFFVTVRCFQRRYLLRPSPETNEVLGGVLSRAVRLHGVEIYAFSVVSNHLHLVVRAPRGNLPGFMQYLLTNVSKKVGRLVGWRGSFWERRYSAEPILDETALLERVRYVLSHGVKEGLVRRCRDWPGLSCLPLMVDGKPRSFRWFNWTRRTSGNGRRVARPLLDDRWAEAEELRLTPLPNPTLRTRDALRGFLKRAVRAIEEQGSRLHRTVLGRAGVLRQRPHAKPASSERKPRPLCHTSIPELLEAFRERYRGFVEAFRQASIRWRKGDPTASFPDWAIKPFVWPASAPLPLAA
jgi:REP element-mobilizing transposase RayT